MCTHIQAFPLPEREVWFVPYFSCDCVFCMAAGLVFRHMAFISLLHQALVILFFFNPWSKLSISFIHSSNSTLLLFVFIWIECQLLHLDPHNRAMGQNKPLSCVHWNDKLLGPVAGFCPLFVQHFALQRPGYSPWLEVILQNKGWLIVM